MASRNLRTVPQSSSVTGRMALFALVLATAGGCGAPADELEDEGQLGQMQQELRRPSRPQNIGGTCTGGRCTCDKGIENDCEEMTSKCVDEDIDDVIACIGGWGTTHCTCRERGADSLRPSVFITPEAGTLDLVFAR